MEELEILLDKLRYLSPRCIDRGLRRLAAPRRRRGFLRRCGSRDDAARRPRRPRRGGRATAPGHRGRAVARVAEPARGGAARGPGAGRRRRLRDGARSDRRDGRPQRPHHDGDRMLRARPGGACRCGATGPRPPSSIPVSILGAGDVLLARWLAGAAEHRPAEEALRLAVAAGSASVLEVGAGRFDPKGGGALVLAGRGRRAPTLTVGVRPQANRACVARRAW